MSITGLIIVILCGGLMFVFMLLNRSRPLRGLRVIPAFSRLRRAMALAVEDGSRLHVSLGSASLLSSQSASALVGLSMLDRIAQLSSISDRPPVVTSGDSVLAILSQDTLRSSFQAANALDQYDPTRGRLTGFTPFSYAVGATPAILDESVSANVLVGHFGPEVALLTDAAVEANAFSLAASDGLPGQAVLYSAAQEPLIGEELFAGGAYLQAGPMHAASLRAQDVLRWVLAASMLVGALLKLLGIL
ncbi:MAG TPA: DUF6754 domain-containing protein [Anaerolineaceae bacterium]|nr:DUF6754 domain-containing protein [Anaerolineaceae bacterium]